MPVSLTTPSSAEEHGDPISAQPPLSLKAKPWLVAGLLLVTLAGPLYLQMHTASITEDGVTFIHFARQLDGDVRRPDVAYYHGKRSDWSKSILDHLCQYVPALIAIEAADQHPGYPFTILIVQCAVGHWLAVEPIMQWTRSAQLSGLLGGCLLTFASYLLGRQLLGTGAGLTAALITVTAPAFVCQRAETLSDSYALSLLAFSALYGIRLTEGAGTRAAFLCGLFGGLGYLFRPEALQFALVMGLLLVVRAFSDRSRRRLLVHGFVLALPLLACCAPNMFLRGAILTKSAAVLTEVALQPESDPQLERVSEACAESNDTSLPTPLSRLRRRAENEAPPEVNPLLALAKGIKQFFKGWVNNLGYGFAGCLLLGAFVQRHEIRNRLSHAMIWTIVLLNGILLAGVLYQRKGYLDHRHVFQATILTMAWCWPGLQRLGSIAQQLSILCTPIINARSVSRDAEALRSGARWRLSIDVRSDSASAPRAPLRKASASRLTIAIAIMLACASALLSLPPTFHGERNGYRLAGEWLRGRVPANAQVVEPEGLVSHYADLMDRNCWEHDHLDLSVAYLNGMLIRRTPVTFLIYSDRFLRDHGLPDGMPAQIGRHRLDEVQTVAASLDPAYPRQVRIWQVKRPARVSSELVEH